MITVPEVTELRRSHAVDTVPLAARPGGVTGFLGPRGAGTSTTMRITVGLTPASCGEESTIAGIAVPPGRPLPGPARALPG